MQAILFISALFFSLGGLSPDNKWQDGYIVKVSGDTISGKVKLSKYSPYQYVYFHENGKEKHVKFDAKEIKAYKFGDEIFRSFNISNPYLSQNYSFGQLIIEGHLSLFYIHFKDVTCSCNLEGSIEKGYILSLIEAKPLVIEKKLIGDKFMKPDKIADYLSGFEQLSEKIRIEFYGYSQISIIVTEYNEWVAQ